MSTTWIAAVLATITLGLVSYRLIGRRRRRVAPPDPRDEIIRELQAQVSIARDGADRATQQYETAAEALGRAVRRTDELEAALATARRQYDSSHEFLKQEIAEKNELRDDADRLRRQVDELATRAEELELELRLASQVSEAQGDDQIPPEFRLAEDLCKAAAETTETA